TVDHSNVDTTGEIVSEVITVNFQTRTLQGVATPNLGLPDREVWGVPSFWGNDQYLTIQRLDPTGGSIHRIPLNADWSGQPSNIEPLNDYDAAMPIMHRAGVRSLSGDLRASSTSLDFGSLAAGQRASQRLTLTNSGNRDIEITSMATSRTRPFRHNGVNCLLPRGKQMTITVTYTAGNTAGSESDTLGITSDADTPTLSISLVGQSLGASGGETTPDDGDTLPDGGDTTPDDRGGTSGGGGGGGGGGCFVLSLQPH
ncbi:MAG: choice-of-anchor D domain-containing protein, partial [Desulfosarcinaceae bacterium]